MNEPNPADPVLSTNSPLSHSAAVLGGEVARRKREREMLLSYGITEDLGNGILLEMVGIRGGTFWMGSPAEEGRDREKPQHKVTVPSFLMGKYPVTQAAWKEIAPREDLKCDRGICPDQYLHPEPYGFTGDNRPVEYISWYDAVEFCKRLSKLTGRDYRLPSEAEWEYACRAGTTTPFAFGETLTDKLANYDARDTYANGPEGQYRAESIPVGQFPPNGFGLYDMHGNVWEWCADEWHDNYEGAPEDGSAWVGDENKNPSQNKGDSTRSPLRGGAWYDSAYICRSAYRYPNTKGRDHDLDFAFGFRVACGVGVELLDEAGRSPSRET